MFCETVLNKFFLRLKRRFFGDILPIFIFLGKCGRTIKFLAGKNHLLFSPKGSITDFWHGSWYSSFFVWWQAKIRYTYTDVKEKVSTKWLLLLFSALMVPCSLPFYGKALDITLSKSEWKCNLTSLPKQEIFF